MYVESAQAQARRQQVEDLAKYFSEFGLIYYRVRVEIEYFIALVELPLPQLDTFQKSLYKDLRAIYQNFSEEDALKIKEIEKTTNHDVKAVEYFIKEAFDKLNISQYAEFIHFGLTSQDINNTAIPLSLKEAIDANILPTFAQVLEKLYALAEQWKDISLLAH
ncbi:MAG: adenylosuccinate lyase, partial [Proteobacteria bacterium]